MTTRGPNILLPDGLLSVFRRVSGEDTERMIGLLLLLPLLLLFTSTAGGLEAEADVGEAGTPSAAREEAPPPPPRPPTVCSGGWDGDSRACVVPWKPCIASGGITEGAAAEATNRRRSGFAVNRAAASRDGCGKSLGSG